MVGNICYRGKEPWGNVNGGRAESMHRLTHVILCVPIKDRTGRSRVISYHLRDIGGYWSIVGYICYHGK